MKTGKLCVCVRAALIQGFSYLYVCVGVFLCMCAACMIICEAVCESVVTNISSVVIKIVIIIIKVGRKTLRPFGKLVRKIC